MLNGDLKTNSVDLEINKESKQNKQLQSSKPVQDTDNWCAYCREPGGKKVVKETIAENAEMHLELTLLAEKNIYIYIYGYVCVCVYISQVTKERASTMW